MIEKTIFFLKMHQCHFIKKSKEKWKKERSLLMENKKKWKMNEWQKKKKKKEKHDPRL